MASVSNTVTLPGGVIPSNPKVSIRLVASLTSENQPGYKNGETIGGVITIDADEDGLWETDLTPNDEIEFPVGTYWEAVEIASGYKSTPQAFVVTSGGPHWLGDLLIDPPDAIPDSQVYADLAAIEERVADIEGEVGDAATTIAAQAIVDGAIVTGVAEVPISYVGATYSDPRLSSPLAFSLLVRIQQLPTLAPGEFDPIFWFDAQSLASTVGDGVPVATWENLGSSTDAVQATPGLQPVMDHDAINGHPGVVFDGVDDVLKTTATSAIVLDALTVFCVFKLDSTGGSFQTIYGGTSNSGLGLVKQQLYRNNGNATMRAGSILPDSAMAADVVHYSIAEFNGSSSRLWIDDVLVVSGSTGDIPTAHLMTLGGDNVGSPFKGAIGGQFALPGVLTDEQRNDLYVYMTNRWAEDV